MKKIDELVKEKQKYIKEKQTIEQELNKKEQELNKKEQKLVKNKKEINNLEFQNKLLKERLDNLQKSNDLRNKENNELRDEIEKLRLNMIDDLKKLYKVSNTQPKIIQDVRKRDDKARTFAPIKSEIYQNIGETTYLPEYGEESDRAENLQKEYVDTLEEKKSKK